MREVHLVCNGINWLIKSDELKHHFNIISEHKPKFLKRDTEGSLETAIKNSKGILQTGQLQKATSIQP